MKKFILLLLAMVVLWHGKLFAAADLTYSNSDFNQTQPGWADTLTIYNHSASPVVITQLAFDTNYDTLDTSALSGSIYHAQTAVVPEKKADYDYRYKLSTESPYNKGEYTTIPANGSVTLTQIPLAHEQTALHGIPIYFRLPFNVTAILQDGTQVAIPLNGSCAGAACNDPAKGRVISSYFTDWANYHYSQNPSNMLLPNQLPIKQMNTIVYAIGKIDANTADINFVDINHDQYYLPAFDTLKQQFTYLNLFYSFGGWGDAGSNSYPSYDLAAIFDQQNPVLVNKLADNMINTMLSLGFNGIDIDYEWNAVQPGTSDAMQLTSARALGYQQLLQALKTRIDKIQPNDDPHYYKISSAVFSGADKVDEFVSNGGDWAKVAAAVDYLSVMAYDMHGQFDVGTSPPNNRTDFQSGMESELNSNPGYNVDSAINAYLNQKVPANKLVLGLPAYARIEKTLLPVTDTNKALLLALATDQPPGESGSGGTTDYKCILNNNYCWGGFQFNRNTFSYVTANLSGQGLGSAAKTPWAYDKSQQWFMSFDDMDSTKYKTQWARNNSLLGVMVWEIDGDVPVSDANYQRDSIIYNAWFELTT